MLISGPDEALCTGVPATLSDGAAHASGSMAVVENTFAGVNRLGLKKAHSEERNWAGLCQFEKWKESRKLKLPTICQVAPKSAVAATRRPLTGPVKVSLRTLVREVRPLNISL